MRLIPRAIFAFGLLTETFFAYDGWRTVDRRRFNHCVFRMKKCCNKLVDRPLARYKSVDPMQVGQPHAETALWPRILDPKRNDDLAGVPGNRDLTPDIFTRITVVGEYEKHR